MNLKNAVCVILVAGGSGSRMKLATPKQYLCFQGKPLARHSFDLFQTMPEMCEIVVVCAEEYRHLFSQDDSPVTVTYAQPGLRRQDSVYHGFQAICSNPSLVCIHDAARPFITDALVRRTLLAANEYGAATAAMPVRFTVKESDAGQLVKHTPERSKIWEIQTPQVIQPHLLKEGFHLATKNNLTVSDDVSLVELLQKPVKLVEGCYSNIKITTPEDLVYLR